MLVNGEPAQNISIEDRGLLYGDGLFETILCDLGKPVLLDLHCQRLQQGCERLHIPVPDMNLLRQEIDTVAACEDCVIKVIITRGVRTRGYRFDHHDTSTSRIVYKSPCPQIPEEYYQHGIELGVSEFRLADNEILAGLKHLNRLEQVMACYEWPPECAELLMLNHQGQVIEGTMSNIFIQSADGWKTPILKNSGINGVLREWILANASQLNIECSQQTLSLDDIKQAQSIFVCNSVIGVWPVKQFLQQPISISDSLVEITQEIQRQISAHFLSATNV